MNKWMSYSEYLINRVWMAKAEAKLLRFGPRPINDEAARRWEKAIKAYEAKESKS